VKAVNKDSVEYFNKSTNQTEVVPFGLCLWATGLATNKLVSRIIEKIGQKDNKRCLLTDSFLHLDVPEAGNRVFAIGDCATTKLPSFITSDKVELEKLFSSIDVSADGFIDYNEFQTMCDRALTNYPILASRLQIDKLKQIFNSFDQDGNKRLDTDEFASLLENIKNNLTAFPATAQCAAQMGSYVAKRVLNLRRQLTTEQLLSPEPLPTNPKFHPEIYKTNLFLPYTNLRLGSMHIKNPLLERFAYRHVGSLAYIGEDRAVFDFGDGKNLTGIGAFIMWKGIYLHKAVSWRTRLALAVDWMKTFLFGRDVSKS
jgi:NADH dehydrogenase FAD-containing subunit